jgi:hypothetical protein
MTTYADYGIRFGENKPTVVHDVLGDGPMVGPHGLLRSVGEH